MARRPIELAIGSPVTHDIALNPEHVICTLDEGASIRMEFTADLGKGYVPSDQNRPDDAPIGFIPVDSLYSPVKKVSYKVENTRVPSQGTARKFKPAGVFAADSHCVQSVSHRGWW